ncbi:MAG: ABC transporter ATP-binding protein, partial [Woeseiaceae bacterium]
HILEEVEAVCSRAIIIAEGRILADDMPTTLAARSRYHNAVRLKIAEGTGIDEVITAVEELGSVEKAESDREHGSLIAVSRDGSADMQTFHEITGLVQEKDWAIESLQLEAGRLDEVFRQITGGASA